MKIIVIRDLVEQKTGSNEAENNNNYLFIYKNDYPKVSFIMLFTLIIVHWHTKGSKKNFTSWGRLILHGTLH